MSTIHTRLPSYLLIGGYRDASINVLEHTSDVIII